MRARSKQFHERDDIIKKVHTVHSNDGAADRNCAGWEHGSDHRHWLTHLEAVCINELVAQTKQAKVRRGGSRVRGHYCGAGKLAIAIWCAASSGEPGAEVEGR